MDELGVHYELSREEASGIWTELDAEPPPEARPEARGYRSVAGPTPRRSGPITDPRLISLLDSPERARVVIELDAPACPVGELRSRYPIDADFRSALDRCRDETVRDVLRPLAEDLVRRGATDLAELWLNPSVAATLDGFTLRALERSPAVVAIHDDEREAGTGGYTGIETRAGMRTATFIANGINGGAGGRGGASQRYGIVEVNFASENFPNVTHAGFRIPSFWLTRFARNMDCRSGTCVNTSATGVDTHGTRVARVLAGSIELGTDPTITDPFERIRRSGNAQLGAFYYYSVDGTCSSWRAAVQRAVVDSVDVLNVSSWLGCSGSVGTGPCWTDCDCAGLNQDLRTATAAGTLIVAMMGNFGGGAGTCTAVYPAIQRDLLAVGGLATPSGGTNYDTAVMHTNSGRGGVDTRLWTGTTVSRAQAVADLVAPYDVRYVYAAPPSGYGDFSYGGTSFATPAVAGAMGLLRQQFASIGWPTADARLLHVHGVLMGDGFHSDIGGDFATHMDRRSGAGRAHFHYPYSPSLVFPWGWSWHSFMIGPGGAVEFPVGGAGPESPSIRQWKGALLWDEPDATAAADIVFEVRDHCPAGGGGPTTIAADNSFDYRKRIELAQGQISNRCLYYRARAFSVPPGQLRRVYIAQYFHSGDPADH